MGSAIAAIEKCQPVPNTPKSKSDLVAELQDLVDRLRVFDVLAAYVATIEYTGSAKDAKYFLISLNIDTGKLQVLRYKARQSEAANAKYTELEGALSEGSSTQIALVSADNIAALRRAYPNYFLDTKVFRDLVGKVLQGHFPAPQNLQTNPVAA